MASEETKNEVSGTSGAATGANGMMTKEDKSFLLQAIWEALLAPQWKKNDLIDLGKVVFCKVKLNKLDDATFERLFPFLTEMTESLGHKLYERGQQAIKAAVAAAEIKEEKKETP
jgi:hypothetical protein